MSPLQISAVVLVSLGVTSQLQAQFAWQNTNSYQPPNYTNYFSDSKSGGGELSQLWYSGKLQQQTNEPPIDLIREGLHTGQVDMEVLRWLGNIYIWNKQPQHPEAIELMYHAADHKSRHAHNAVYFGLSTVKPKTPAILRTLAKLALIDDSPDMLGRIAWGVQDQKQEFLTILHQLASLPPQKEKAAVVQKMVNQELRALDWAMERWKKEAREKHGHLLPDLAKKLHDGNSEERREVLTKLGREKIMLILPDDFLPAMVAAAQDKEERVRRTVATMTGERWMWHTNNYNPEAVQLLIRLSEDPEREVRSSAIYFGLCRMRPMSTEVMHHLLQLAVRGAEKQSVDMIVWGLQSQKAEAISHLKLMIPQASASEKQTLEDLTRALQQSGKVASDPFRG
jgi:hypothetical protein